MKKLFALLLSVIMAVSLTAPAFAAEPENAASPSAFLPEATNDSAFGIIGGQDGPTSIITIPIPGADWDNSSEMTIEQLIQQQIDSIKESLGGVPGQIGVMVNGEYVQFPDAVPEMKDGCAMVPIRALAEVLGGQVAYGEEEKEQLVKEEGKTFLTFTVDSDRVIVEYPSGSGEVRTLSCAPYIKDGRAYVPVRFMGEVLGYEVGWDSQFQTAILLDREALAAEIDENFSILNRVQAASSASIGEGRSCRADMEGSVTVTAFDTLNGDKTYTAELAGETLLSTEAVNGSYSLTLSDSAVDALLGLMSDESGEDPDTLRAVLENLSLDVIMAKQGLSHDLDAYSVLIHIPVLDELTGEKNLWYQHNMGAELGQVMFTGMGAATMGTVLASMVRTDSVESWVMVNEAVRQTAAVYGDGNFTTSDGTSTLVIDLDTLDPDGDLGLKDVYEEYQITVKVDSEGGAMASSVVKTAGSAGMPGMSMTMESTQSGGKADVSMKIHVSNVCEVTLELTSTQQAADEQPLTEPSGGANIMPAENLLNN